MKARTQEGTSNSGGLRIYALDRRRFFGRFVADYEAMSGLVTVAEEVRMDDDLAYVIVSSASSDRILGLINHYALAMVVGSRVFRSSPACPAPLLDQRLMAAPRWIMDAQDVRRMIVEVEADIMYVNQVGSDLVIRDIMPRLTAAKDALVGYMDRHHRALWERRHERTTARR